MGKGDKRRPTEVSDSEFANNWCKAFGHRPNSECVCRTCGATNANPYVSNTDEASLIPNTIRREP